MKWILGIDGGGTKTTACAATMDGNLLGRVEKGAANYHVTGLRKFMEVIGEIIADICCDNNLRSEDLRLVSLGLAGVHRAKDRELITTALQQMELSCSFVVNDDATIALAAGLGGADGIVLIAGTGSVAYGINKQGKIIRAGGWGHIISDEGSGYDIGRQALVRGVRAAEGRDKPSDLLPEIIKYLGVSSQDDLIDFVHSPATGKKGVAALAKVVAATASQGDPVAMEILADAANSLASLVESVIDRGFPGGELVAVCTYGGVFRNIPFVRQLLASRLAGKALLVAGAREPVMGAIELGYAYLNSYKV